MTLLRWTTRIGYLLAVLALLSLLASGPAYRLGWADLGTIFAVLRLAVFAGMAAIAILLVGRLGGATGNTALAVILLLGAVLYLPVQQAIIARSVPAIHDISTDTVDPPRFSATMRAARENASNPPEYAGPETARLQREAYPGVRSLTVEAPPRQVIASARDLVATAGWELVHEDVSNGRLEASVTTWWFGFVDDVIIRVREQNGHSVVDVRSKSRIGRSDIGANARRIREFLAALQAALPDGSRPG